MTTTTPCDGSGRSPLITSPNPRGNQETRCRDCQTIFVGRLPSGAVIDADISRVPDHWPASERTEVQV